MIIMIMVIIIIIIIIRHARSSFRGPSSSRFSPDRAPRSCPKMLLVIIVVMNVYAL